MSVVLKKRSIDTNVYDKAIERINILYDRFDRVAVSFSGGKDSTVCLNLTLKVARERGRLPLDVYFLDEEAIYPETIEYVQRVYDNKADFNLKWLCMPGKHRNACSRTQPWWYPWRMEDKAKWVRPMPPQAITHLKGFKHGMTMADCMPLIYRDEGYTGTVAHIRGIRANESLSRYRSVARSTVDNWMGFLTTSAGFPESDRAQRCASPIYDWVTDDVWIAPKLFGWDYNKTYDILDKLGISKNSQRVCPPFGEEPLRSLWIYAQGWSELWHKMIYRVHGAATAARYSETELYGFGKPGKPQGVTWKEYAYQLLDLYSGETRSMIASSITTLLKDHQRKTSRPIHDDIPDPYSGFCWEFLANLISRGDLKGRRSGNSTVESLKTLSKMGLPANAALVTPEAEMTKLFNAYLKKIKQS